MTLQHINPILHTKLKCIAMHDCNTRTKNFNLAPMQSLIANINAISFQSKILQDALTNSHNNLWKLPNRGISTKIDRPHP